MDTCSLKSWLRLLSICHIVDMKSSLEASNSQVLNGHLQGKVIISFISLSLEERLACLSSGFSYQLMVPGGCCLSYLFLKKMHLRLTRVAQRLPGVVQTIF